MKSKKLSSRSDRRGHLVTSVVAGFALVAAAASAQSVLDAAAIGKAAGVAATATDDGVVRIGWAREDVKVTVDGVPLHPFAGLGSWAAFHSARPGGHAIVMGDTVVFEDEVDAAIDAAFAHGLEVTGLHNHFLFEEPRVFFLHLGGSGEASELARGVKALWDAVRGVRARTPAPAPAPAERSAGASENGISAPPLEAILGLRAAVTAGIAKFTWGRTARMHGVEVGGSMGITTWAAFSGTDARAAVSGDFVMADIEVQRVLRALRAGGLSIVALHHHMLGEEPPLYFVHFWAKGPAEDLARAVLAAREAQRAAR